MPAPAATSKLDAVNLLLSTIRQARITALPSATPTIDETEASATIDEQVKWVQIVNHFHWNLREKRVFPADGVGDITLPTNTAFVDYIRDDKFIAVGAQDKIAERNGKLYNVDQDTTNFGAFTTKELMIVYWLDFADLPESARHAVVMRARYEFMLKRKPESPLLTHFKGIADEAEREMRRDHRRRRRPNMLEHPDVRRPLRRTYTKPGPLP